VGQNPLNGENVLKIPRPATAAVILGFTLACTDSTSPHAASLDARLSLANPVTRPINVDCTVADTVVAPYPGPTQPIMTLAIGGTCRISHIGRATMHATQIVNLAAGTISNTTTYTAPNGDQLITQFVSGAGQSTFDGTNATFEGTETYVGGTGRFANASGSSDLVGSAVLSPATGLGVGEYVAIGTITY
jgi:hypothetical protein